MPREKSFPDFIAVIVDKHDTYSSLASQYLNDPTKGWVIAEYNEIDTLKEGQKLVIPLTSDVTGGVTTKEYQTVPVLVYHNFSLRNAGRTTVTKDQFAAQMKFLKDNGYHVISLDEFFHFLDYKTRLPRKSVVITLDDGWRGAYEIAYPILKKFGYPATLFIYTDLITGSRKTLSWKQLREMSENGITMQNHTRTHRNLASRDPGESFETYFEEVKHEVTSSSQKIRAKLGVGAQYLAYPYGDTNGLVIALLQKLGYRGAFTASPGSNPFFVNRYRIYRSVIYGDFDMKSFQETLITASRGAL